MLSTDTHFPVHGDPTPGNWIDAGSHLVLIDWEYSGMGDPLWDLAEFSVTASLTPAQERVLWEAHQGEIRTPDAGAAPYPTAHHRDHLRLWKIVCDVVGSVWALDRARGDDPEDVGADLVRYAHRRAERAATALAGPVAETSLRALT
jgi:thiamine kinase-like enzyme